MPGPVDVQVRRVVAADEYGDVLHAEIAYGAFNSIGSFMVEMEDSDGSKQGLVTSLREVQIKIDGVKMMTGMIEGAPRVLDSVGEGRLKRIRLQGRCWGGLALKKGPRFSKDYEYSPADVMQVGKDLVSHLNTVGSWGLTDTGVDSDISIDCNVNFVHTEPFAALQRAAEIGGVDFFIDEDKVLQMFLLLSRSTGKTVTDTDIRRGFYDPEGSRERYRQVRASNMYLETNPLDDVNAWLEDLSTGYWYTDYVTLSKINIGEQQADKALKAEPTGTPPVSHIFEFPDEVYGDFLLNVTEADWESIEFLHKDALTNISVDGAVDLALYDSSGPGVYWWRDIIGDLSATWKRLKYELPTKDPSGWNTVGSPTKINWVQWAITPDTAQPSTGGDLRLANIHLRRVRTKTASVAGTPLLEKLVVGRDVTADADLQSLADKELVQVQDPLKESMITIDGDSSYRDPGYTVVLNSAELGASSVTLRLDEIRHIVEGQGERQSYTTVLGLNSSIRAPIHTALRRRTFRQPTIRSLLGSPTV